MLVDLSNGVADAELQAGEPMRDPRREQQILCDVPPSGVSNVLGVPGQPGGDCGQFGVSKTVLWSLSAIEDLQLRFSVARVGRVSHHLSGPPWSGALPASAPQGGWRQRIVSD
jgi:hypothetical protein